MEKLPLGLALDLRKVVPYKTGSWRTLMPVNIMQTPPCTNSCPSGNDIRGFLRVLAEKQDYEEAWQSWLEIYQTSTDDRVIKIAANHLYNVKASRDIQLIKDAINLYSEKFGRRPLNLEQLVREGFLSSVPKDMDEKDYIYNPQTNEVRTETIWSKR